jgi:hypothetical protein
MFTLNFPILINTYCGNFDAANDHIDELIALAEEKGAPFRRAEGVLRRGYVLTLTKAATAVETVSTGIDLWRSAGSTIFTPEHEFMLAVAHANSNQFDEAWDCIGKSMAAMQATKERWCEAEPTAWRVRSHSNRHSVTSRERKPILSIPWPPREHSRQNRGNCARPRAWRGF